MNETMKLKFFQSIKELSDSSVVANELYELEKYTNRCDECRKLRDEARAKLHGAFKVAADLGLFEESLNYLYENR